MRYPCQLDYPKHLSTLSDIHRFKPNMHQLSLAVIWISLTFSDCGRSALHATEECCPPWKKYAFRECLLVTPLNRRGGNAWNPMSRPVSVNLQRVILCWNHYLPVWIRAKVFMQISAIQLLYPTFCPAKAWALTPLQNVSSHPELVDCAWHHCIRKHRGFCEVFMYCSKK